MNHSDPRLSVIHTVRLVGFVDASTVARRVGLPVGEVERLLADAVDDGFARHRSGARPGWSLTDEGRKEGERLLADELDRSGRRGDVTDAYRRFLPLNRRLLEVCTAWQVVDPATGAINDHGDADYDRAVVARLGEIDRGVQPICARLGTWFDRFSGYGRRLRSARERVEAGDVDWFTRPTIDSYHTVWFELHEDLLATLGLDRTSERHEAPQSGAAVDPATGSTATTGAAGTPDRT
jgi:hypothetical protein